MSKNTIISGSIPCTSNSTTNTNSSNLITAAGSIPCLNPFGSPVLSSFGGKVPNPTTQIKQFYATDNSNASSSAWIYDVNPILPNEFITLTPTVQSSSLNVYIPGDLTVMGTILNPSDEKLKQNISDLDHYEFNKILEIEPKSFSFKNDSDDRKHFGIIAQDLEQIIPCLVSEDIHNKYINYLELIPLMIGKIKDMQKELDELKNR
jgi:hypothetical protein